MTDEAHQTLCNEDSSPPQEKPNPEDEPPKDEEGLLREYDVIICGTGLVQSILASALSRAGKSVLHCDGQGHYGELDAVLNLPYLQEGSFWNQSDDNDDDSNDSTDGTEIPLHTSGPCHSLRLHSTSKSSSPPPLEVGTKVSTPHGRGVVKALPHLNEKEEWSSLEVSIQDWKLADGSHAVAYFGTADENPETAMATLVEQKIVVPLSHIENQKIFDQSRSFALDVSPRLLYASGHAVTGMLTSGVADYMEFKSLEGLFWISKENNKWELSRVPCSKGDVFGTKLLKPVDKRRLMKFLQLTLDYATAATLANEAVTMDEKESQSSSAGAHVPEEDVQSLNERQLNQGRALARPQNKAVSTADLQKLQNCIDEDMDFETYLKEEQRLSPRLTSLVRHALALETLETSSSTLEGMTSLCQHVQALGRYGTTAFLVPLYGSGELPQAFCRSSAVHGGTYLLRRAPKRVLLQEDGQAVKGIVLAGDCESNDVSLATGHTEDKTVLCQHVVVSQDAVGNNADSTSKRRTLRRISILRGKLVGEGEQRHVIVFPPRTCGNSHVIHGIAVDDSVHVAPCGCTVLHLTTTVDGGEQINESILEKAVESIVSSTLGENGGSRAEVDEIFHVSYSYAVSEKSNAATSPSGMHLCHHTGQNLVIDTAFEQAMHIFGKICPDVDFLKLSEEMDTVVKERIGDREDDNDDEKMYLQSAMNMIEKASEDKQSEPRSEKEEIPQSVEDMP